MKIKELKGFSKLQCPCCKTWDAQRKYFVTHVLEDHEFKVTEYQCPNCFKLFRKKRGSNEST